jgi:aspartate aminotransferase
MPSISMKGKTMPASPIRKLVPFSEKAKARGIKVYHLNIGQPDIETPSNILDKIRSLDLKVIEYSHSAGMISYRKKLVEYYKRFDIDVTPEEMIVTTGGSEAILFALNSCLDPGDEIIIPEPFYIRSKC